MDNMKRCTDSECEYAGVAEHYHDGAFYNPMGAVPAEDEQYEDLTDLISFEGFDFSKYYEHEDTILRPRMEEKGFYAITFKMGEFDSFGPLSRVVTAIDKEGKNRKFVYG